MTGIHARPSRPWGKEMIAATFAAVILGLATLTPGVAQATARHAALDKSAMATLRQCRIVSSSCAVMTKNAVGILVFPSVTKADLIIGGAGGEGALIEGGKITGYYNIGAASAGLQAGLENAKQVYVFRSEEALAKLKEGPDWKAGATAGVTVVKADANAGAVTGDVLAYIFDSKGLHAGVSVDVFDVWEHGKARPSES